MSNADANQATPVGEDDVCTSCFGRGGDLEHDTDGDGVWATPVTRLDTCAKCLGASPPKCPGCGTELQRADADDMANGDSDCSVCGWRFDMDRFAPDDEDAPDSMFFY